MIWEEVTGYYLKRPGCHSDVVAVEVPVVLGERVMARQRDHSMLPNQNASLSPD
jgi:hypothetical protein